MPFPAEHLRQALRDVIITALPELPLANVYFGRNDRTEANKPSVCLRQIGPTVPVPGGEDERHYRDAATDLFVNINSSYAGALHYLRLNGYPVRRDASALDDPGDVRDGLIEGLTGVTGPRDVAALVGVTVSTSGVSSIQITPLTFGAIRSLEIPTDTMSAVFSGAVPVVDVMGPRKMTIQADFFDNSENPDSDALANRVITALGFPTIKAYLQDENVVVRRLSVVSQDGINEGLYTTRTTVDFELRAVLLETLPADVIEHAEIDGRVDDVDFLTTVDV